MARPKRDPYIYKVNGFYWAFFSRDERVSLQTQSAKEAAERFGEKLRNQGLRKILSREKSFAEIVKITYDRSCVDNSDKTAYENGLNFARISAWLEARDITKAHEITKNDIEEYKAFRAPNVGAARINRELTSWIKVMKVAVELDEAQASILEQFERLPEPKPNPQRTVHRRESIEAFFSKLDTRYLPLAKFTLGSGLRDDELRHIQAQNLVRIEREEKVYYQVTVTPLPASACECHPKGFNTKNYRYRTVPISSETYKAGLLYIETRKQYNLDKKFSQRKVWQALYDACTEVKIEPISMHDLRHTAASYWLNAGIKIATIQRWLGHSSLDVTMRYLHGIDDDLPEAEQLPF